MNSLNTIRTIVAGSNNTLAIATQELPTALVNQPQLGNANTIGAIYAHTLLTLDHFYQTATLRPGWGLPTPINFPGRRLTLYRGIGMPCKPMDKPYWRRWTPTWRR